MRRACAIVRTILLIAWLIALALFLLSIFGLFGQEMGPLAAVFLIPLGLPWTLFIDWAPEPAWPWHTALAPLLNIVLLALSCRALPARQRN